jgi:peptidoglycan/LPS O-acetylase OafA/YrhL
MMDDDAVPQVQRLKHGKYRPDIDGLRAIAVLSVVVFHAFPGVLRGGFIGVDVFFVISGFLISSIIIKNLEGGRFSYADFYTRRIKRIFPALILVLTASLVGGWFDMPADYKAMGKHVMAGAGFVSNFAFWNEAGYFDVGAEAKPLLHLWSLGIEEQFYLVWPLLLGFAWKRRRQFLPITIFILCASFLWSLHAVRSDPVAAFYSPLSRFWELLVGGVLAYLTLHAPQHLPRSKVAPAVGLAMILLGVAILTAKSPFPGAWALLPTGGAFLVIASGPDAWVNRKLLGNRALVAVGLISYPLYLWHWPALYAVRQLAREHEFTHAQFVTSRVVAIAASVLLAWLTYRLVERPIRFGKAEPRVAYALAGVLAAVALFGGVTYGTSGFVNRLPPGLAGMLSFDYEKDRIAWYRSGSCLLFANQGPSSFGSCTTGPAGKGVDNLLLWGDSHAAHLSPGLLAANGSTSRITQLTASSCPPLVGYVQPDVPHCAEITDYVLGWIAKEKPVRVILAGRWTEYDWRPLDDTVQRLKRLGVSRIELVGPVPLWKNPLPRQLYQYVRRAHEATTLPSRMTFGLDERIAPLDGEMRAFAKAHGVRYLSPYEVLCNAEGCLTKVRDTPVGLTAWDTGHLTGAAAGYVMSHFEHDPGAGPVALP